MYIDKISVCRWLSILLSMQIRRPCAHTRALTTRGESIASLWTYSDFTSNVQQRMRRRKFLKNPFIVAFSDCRRSVGIDIVIIQTLLEKKDQRASLWGSYSDLALTCKIYIYKPLCRRLSINLSTNRRVILLGKLASQRRP